MSLTHHARTLLRLETHAPDETKAFGRALADQLQPGAVVALFGDLGAGKTHLVKGICSALGVAEAEVNSPTFTLVNEYSGAPFPVYHFDAYRIKHADEFFEMGYEDYFYGEGLCLIEWPSRIASLLPDDTLVVYIEHVSEQVRRIRLMQPDDT